MNMTRLGQENVNSKYSVVKLPFERLDVNSDKTVLVRFDPVFNQLGTGDVPHGCVMTSNWFSHTFKPNVVMI